MLDIAADRDGVLDSPVGQVTGKSSKQAVCILWILKLKDKHCATCKGKFYAFVQWQKYFLSVYTIKEKC